MPGERFIVGNPESSEDDTTLFFGESCQDITGRTIPGGNHYVPGPDSCTVCLCDGGKPKWCQAVLCAAPKVKNLPSIIFFFFLPKYNKYNFCFNPGLQIFSHWKFLL